MEGTSDPGARKGAGRNGLVRGATPRSRGSLSDRATSADRQREAGSVTTRERCNGTEGAGRGDTVRLRARGTLRRVDGVARSEARLSRKLSSDHPGGSATVPWERVSVKRGEPHDRQRGATNPRALARRKPSGWCETTRAERELDGWCRRPEGVSGQLGALGCERAWVMSVEGQAGREPQERMGLGPRSALRRSVGVVARGPARVRTLRRRWKIMESRCRA
jgi:hypothetical protein